MARNAGEGVPPSRFLVDAVTAGKWKALEDAELLGLIDEIGLVNSIERLRHEIATLHAALRQGKRKWIGRDSTGQPALKPGIVLVTALTVAITAADYVKDHPEAKDAIDAAVQATGALILLKAVHRFGKPLHDRKKAISRLANKSSRVSPEERTRVLELNNALREAFPVKTQRYLEIANRLNKKQDRIRRIVEPPKRAKL